jgi:hypothetical protein
MKRFLLTTLSFLILPLLTYIIIICVWGDISTRFTRKQLYYYPIGAYGHTYSRLKEARNTENVDILFVGSSHTYRGFDTRIFKKAGYKTFNLGSSSQTPIQTKVLINRYINNLNPKLVVFEVYQETFISDGVESSLDILANDKNDINSLKMALTIKNKLTYNALIYSFYRQFTKRNTCYEPKERNSDKYIEGGYVEKDLMYFKDTIKYNPRILKWNHKQFEAFEDILATLSDKNIKVILVQLPLTTSLNNSYINNDEFDKKMMNYGKYYNYNKLIKLNDSIDFFDDDHMNQLGVISLNNDFLKIVMKEYPIRKEN